jgi:hypothetical protein
MDTQSRNREFTGVAIGVGVTALAIALDRMPVTDSWRLSGTLFVTAALLVGWGLWPRRLSPILVWARRLRLRWPIFISDEKKREPAPRAPTFRAPSAEDIRREREMIQDIRVLWTRHAQPAGKLLYGILHGMIFTQRDTIYWMELLRPVQNALYNAMELLDAGLTDVTTPLAEVRKRFKAFWAAYAQALIWVAEVAYRESVDPDAGVANGDVEAWRAANKHFRDKLDALCLSPEHQGWIESTIKAKALTAFVRFQDGDLPQRPTLPGLRVPSVLSTGEPPSAGVP